jgi:hypothetical protein
MQVQLLEALNNAIAEKDYENCSLGESPWPTFIVNDWLL